MSMNLRLLRASDRDIARLQANPENVESFIYPSEAVVDRGPEYAKARADLARQMGIPLPKSSKSASSKSAFDTYAFRESFDAQKMWQGLYYLLTGSDYAGSPPASWLLNSPAIGDDAFGYGPVMAISAGNTKILSDYLTGLDRKTVLDHFDGAEMMGLNLYPNIWEEDATALKTELGDTFDHLCAYCRKCVEFNLGMLSYIV